MNMWKTCDHPRGMLGKKHSLETLAHMRQVHTRPVSERLLRDSIPEPNTGCWLWMGVLMPNGYGQLSINGRHAYAHRASYETFVGPIPEGLTIDHLCRQRCCINPEHLEPVTTRVNLLRGDGASAKNAQKTTCALGHPLSGDNLALYRGQRWCNECGRRRAREYRARMRARKAI